MRRSFFLGCVTSLRLNDLMFADLIKWFALFQGRPRVSEKIPRTAQGAGRDGRRRAQQWPAGVSPTHTHTYTHGFMNLLESNPTEESGWPLTCPQAVAPVVSPPPSQSDACLAFLQRRRRDLGWPPVLAAPVLQWRGAARAASDRGAADLGEQLQAAWQRRPAPAALQDSGGPQRQRGGFADRSERRWDGCPRKPSEEEEQARDLFICLKP